jgi:hypothetical protein
MKRRVAVLLSAAILTTGVLVMAPASRADHCDRYGRWGRGSYYPVYYRGGAYWGRRFDGPCCRRDEGPSIGTILLGAGAAYGAYRVLDDLSKRHRRHRDDDD